MAGIAVREIMSRRSRRCSVRERRRQEEPTTWKLAIRSAICCGDVQKLYDGLTTLWKGLIMPPTFANGKICYIEMPAADAARSADFYQRVFGWNIRQRGDGSTAFDDAAGEVSGTWVLGRPPAAKPGLLFYIMVDSVAATIDAVVAHGGE